MTQPSLLDALLRVDEHADPDWKDVARDAIAFLATTRHEFTTDDVWAELDRHSATTHEPRALGALMRKAARQRLIAPTDRYVTSTRAACHSRPVKVWRTLR